MSYSGISSAGDTGGVARTLQNLADIARNQGDDKDAREHYRDSLIMARDMGDQVTVVDCLEGLAMLAGRARVPRRAARLLGAADTLRRAIGVPVRATDREVYDSGVAVLRGELGEAGFSAAWIAGQTLPLEAAIAEALQDG
jgi:hypothetical protein